MTEPLVSVMVPTYGQAEFIGETLTSVLCQDYSNLEVIVSDDYSPDQTEEVVRSFLSDSRVIYKPTAQNIGRVANYRRTLYELAQGKYVTNLDGDDLLGNPSYIRNAVAALEDNPSASLCFGQVIRFRGKTPEIDMDDSPGVSVLDGTKVFLNYWKRTNKIHHLGTVYRRDLADNFYRRNIISSDIESLLRIMPGYSLLRLNTAAGLWRGHEVNASVGASGEAALKNLSMIDSVAQDPRVRREIPNGVLSVWRRRMLHARIYGSTTTHFLRKGLRREGFRFLISALKVYPEARWRLLLDMRLWGYFFLPIRSK